MNNQPPLGRLILIVLAVTALCFVAAHAPAAELDAGAVQVNAQADPLRISLHAGEKQLLEVRALVWKGARFDRAKAIAVRDGGLDVKLADDRVVRITPVTGGVRFHCDDDGSGSIAIELADLGDHFFGLTSQNFNGHNLNMRGHTVGVGMQKTGGGQSHAAVFSTFMMSSRGWGSFFDSFAYGSYQLGVDKKTILSHETGLLNWYVFAGQDGAEIHRGYYALIGRPRVVPMWALAPAYWRNENRDAQQMIDDARQFEKLRMPMGWVWVDRPYALPGAQPADAAAPDAKQGQDAAKADEDATDPDEDAAKPGTLEARFANPRQWIGQLENTHHLRFLTWIKPGPQVEANSSPYVDFTNEAQRQRYARQLRAQYALGIRGHKIDRVNESFEGHERYFSDAYMPSIPPAQRHGMMTYLNAKFVDQIIRERFDDDAFVFARAATNRSSTYLGGIWGGDVSATMGGMAANLVNGLRTGFQGFPIWGSDGGGYIGSRTPRRAESTRGEDHPHISEEQVLRWVQMCLYSGMFEWDMDAKVPWVYPQPLQDAFRATLMRRMELLPYIHSLSMTSDRTGVLMRPLAYVDLDDERAHTVWDQWHFGPAFLVGLVYKADTTEREMYLPRGTWIRADDYAQVHAGLQNVTIPAPRERLPVLIRANTIFPTGMIYAGNMRKWMPDFDAQRSLTLNVFPGAPGESNTFIYVDYLDNNKEKPLKVSVAADGVITVEAPAMTVPVQVAIRLDREPGTISAGGRTLAEKEYGYSNHRMILSVRAGQATAVTIHPGR
jgi:alpha-glucosidase (family GH31 glycosyl hydrolase)